MLEFEFVEIRNFRSFGNTPTKFLLNKNKVTIIHAENGAGKSSILMALEWCLFGRVPNLTKKNIINSTNRGDCVVKVKFKSKGYVYLIERGASPDFLNIYRNGKAFNTQSHLNEQNDVICNLTGIDKEVFHRIVSIRGSDYTPFLLLSLADKRKMFESVLQIELFRVISVLNNKRISEYETQILACQKFIDSLEKLGNNNNPEIENADELLVEFNNANVSLSTILKEKTKEYFQDMLQQARHNKIILVEKLKAIRKEIEFWHNKKCPLCQQSIDEALASKEIGKRVGMSERIASTLQSADAIITEKCKELDSIEALEKQVANVLKRMETIRQTIQTRELQKSDIEMELEKENAKMLALREELCYYKEIKVMLKDNGISSIIVGKYLPEFNKTLNSYLREMEMDVQVEVLPNFETNIKKRNGEKVGIQVFSAGERARIDLCFLFTWRHLSAFSNNSNCSFIFLDEVFDNVLDDEGIDLMLKLLYNLKNVFVFYVSHRKELGEKIQSSISLMKVDGFTRLM